MIFAVDFDGTIVKHAFPDIGEPLPYAFQVLKGLVKLGHKLILNTCREDHPTDMKKQYLSEAYAFCVKHGVYFRSVNENRLEDDFRDAKFLRRKVYAHNYIDDRNWPGGEPDWFKIGATFEIKLTPEEERWGNRENSQ